MLPVSNPARVKIAELASVLLGEQHPSRSPGALRPCLLPVRHAEERLA